MIPPDVPQEIQDLLGGFALAAGGANVIMQLSRLPVGHGVAGSKVDSGRVDKHPLKRLRTTNAYLAVALLGTVQERRAMRREVNRAHARVRSGPSDPVAYNAFDPELQLWVAACLYKGTEDAYRALFGHDIATDRVEAVYQYSQRLGTTLQVKPEMWPADRAAFEEYWQAGLQQVRMDDVTRAYLQNIANGAFLVAPLGRFGRPLLPLLRRMVRPAALGFLPAEIRAELGLPWSERAQRAFEARMRAYAAVTRRLPGPLRRFPLNVYLLDTRRRIRRGRPIV